MGDLISRSALLQRIDKEREFLLGRGLKGAEHILVHNFRDLVEEAPTVEAQLLKLSIKGNGDIVDFEGKVVGHIDIERYTYEQRFNQP